MATKNDITGDTIQSKVASKQYRDNFADIFRKPKMSNYFLFLDDLRIPSQAWLEKPNKDSSGIKLTVISGIEEDKWVIVRTYDEFVATLEARGIPMVVSFDHDLHEEHIFHYFKNTQDTGIVEYGNLQHKTGLACAQKLIDMWQKTDKSVKPTIYIHSANKYGKRNIQELLDNHLR